MNRFVVFSGAGISADSGIQTFRGSDGLWNGVDVNIVANWMTWKRNFDVVHDFYNRRRRELKNVRPNKAHYTVAEWQEKYNAVVLTQNIDDLFERAGCRDVVHVHGFLRSMRCLACGRIWDVEYEEWGKESRCECGSKKGVKPNVVFFQEEAPMYKRMYKEFGDLKNDDLLVVIGTSGQVIDIGGMAVTLKCKTILSNLESSSDLWMPGRPCVEDRQFDVCIHGNASEVVPNKLNEEVEKWASNMKIM